MDIARFKEIVSAFLDSGDQADWSKGTALVQIGSELIEASLRTHDGGLYIQEGGKEQAAEKWIINRLAMLDLLADRILASNDENSAFVTPAGEFVDEIQHAASEAPVPVENSVEAVYDFLNRRPGGTCSVLYLTSDAGEGKTTIIEHLARRQAEQYRARKSDWLLVPIGLGGRPFLRFDDVVMAAFMNQLRFQRLYYDAFLQLVRMGVLIPALDGFEEIFVETSEGEAVTGLGTLIRQLGGEGTLLIAARKAFFEFRRLETQARLIDTLPDVDVGFGRVSLRRWTKAEFLEYCQKRGLKDAEELYDRLSARIRSDHPLLTRAVLVRRIVELAKASGSDFVNTLPQQATDSFKWLVERVLEREATEKWINKFGDPPSPLLTVRQHEELLSLIAEEMWVSRSAVLSDRMLESLSDIYTEHKKMGPQVVRQVRERLRQHALLASLGPLRKEVAFDHDHFRHFFLGQQLAQHIIERHISDVRKLFRVDYFPEFALDTAAAELREQRVRAASVIDWLSEASSLEGPSSFVRENAGAGIIRMLEFLEGGVKISDVVFPADSLRARTIKGTVFTRCYFQATSIESAVFDDCVFEDCEFERIEYEQMPKVSNCSWAASSRVHSLSRLTRNDSSDIYDPEKINAELARLGFKLEMPPSVAVEQQEDERLRIAAKAIQTFQRTTHVTEGTFRLRLSVNAHRFFDEVLPDLQRHGILQTKMESSGPKYRLGTSLAQIARALTQSGGSYERFLELATAK